MLSGFTESSHANASEAGGTGLTDMRDIDIDDSIYYSFFFFFSIVIRIFYCSALHSNHNRLVE